MPTLLLIVFINLVGFGLLIPLLPFYAIRLDASPAMITMATMGIFSLVQFITTPIIGRLSDSYGRKPVLVVTMFGTAISYIMLAMADSLEALFIARAFGGLNAGNLGTAYAYIADITTEENRAKGLGMMGAAFGMGFIFGPVIGGVLAGSDVDTANYVLPALLAAGLAGLAFLASLFLLKESLAPEIREKLRNKPKVPLKEKFELAMGRQTLVLLILTSLIFIIAFAIFETIFGLWGYEVFEYGPKEIAFLLGYVGIVSVIIQGGLIGPLTNKFGEQNLVISSLVIIGIGFVALATAQNLVQVIIAITFMSIGGGIMNPSMSSLVSKEADETEQGAVMGIFQGAGSLGRIIGPAISGKVFGSLGAAAPYLLSAFLMIPPILMMMRVRQRRIAREAS